MFKKINWRSTLTWAFVAAVISCIPILIYILKGDYSHSWLLYVGSVLFLFINAAHTVTESRRRGGNESTVALVFVAHVTVICGILFSCLLCLVMLLIFVPGFTNTGHIDQQLANDPAQSLTDKTGALSFHVFVFATLLNFFGGSVAGVTIPFYAKWNQTKDNRDPAPLQQQKVEVDTTAM